MKRVYKAWSHCLLGNIASCEILELVQKWILFSEACPVLSLGAVGWTLTALMAQGAPEVPSTLPQGAPSPHCPLTAISFLLFKIFIFLNNSQNRKQENTFVLSLLFFK